MRHRTEKARYVMVKLGNCRTLDVVGVDRGYVRFVGHIETLVFVPTLPCVSPASRLLLLLLFSSCSSS